MKNFYIAITFLCAALIAFLVLIACALTDKPEEPQAVAPEINADGLCIVTVVKAPEPEYEMYFTEADVVALARMLYGEARGCTVDNQMKCVWCVLNRVDDARCPDSIIGAVSAPGQFYGYSPDFPVLDRLYAVALDVLTRWSLEKQGAEVQRALPSGSLWFFIGWNAAQLRWLNKISDILDTLNWATKTYGELSSDDRSFVRGMLKTIALLQGYEEG